MSWALGCMAEPSRNELPTKVVLRGPADRGFRPRAAGPYANTPLRGACQRGNVQPGRDRNLVTAALMLSNALAALEATAVAAAVPTAVGELGGMARYSWVFSAYLLTCTASVPLYDKLADLYGRRRVFHIA